jgi:hypothetical protein
MHVAPCPFSASPSIFGNTFNISPSVSGTTGGPLANATVVVSPIGPETASPVINPPPCANGACTGFFDITGNVVQGGSSTLILAAYSIPVVAGVPTCSTSPWSAPHSLTLNNSITLTPCT